MGLIYRRSHVLNVKNTEGTFTPIVTLDGQRTFDSELTDTSENAPQTKVIAEMFNDISTRLTELDTAIKNIGSGGGGTGDIPTASAETVGGVKIGDGIDVDETGTISLNEQKVVTIMEENTEEFTEQEIKDLFNSITAV